jgi:uncharacterized protein (DUF924 family)
LTDQHPTTDALHDQILDFWFGPLDENGNCGADYRKRWFTKDANFDRQIREEFTAPYVSLALMSSSRPAWLVGPRGLLAGVIVLDQFSRNMFRDSPAMYSADDVALSLCYEIIALGYNRQLPVAMRTFAYMPLMHSERLADQQRCVELFQQLAEELTGDAQKAILDNVDYAIRHRDIVARFGRFPHRNQILDRTSTDQEIEFLKTPGSGF